ncbi:nucleic acid-binding, OB-fold protein [Artemisia annua]|uniref:Nucleic acid-binding, OB-fold protein n=1 Tax=Artemisia annua TaxID=35608 RepID=A0A2U1QGS9_ARTAN|nr:nucleic acid-binding, OB-fold protein [Artemisia annua]
MAAPVKGEAIEVSPEFVTYENTDPAEMNKVIEVIVYRKWIAKAVPDLISTMYCCMLLDRKHIMRYNQLLGPIQPLQIQALANQDSDIDEPSNKMSIAQMLAVHPDTQKSMRFTIEGVLVRIDNTNRWFYNKCDECGEHMDEKLPHWHCHESAVQDKPNYGYCFKAIIQDDTGSIIATCFTPEADKWTPKTCLEVLNETPNPDPYAVLAALRELENTRKVFRIHFGTWSKKHRQKFVVETAKNIEPLLLPAPPINTIGEESSSNITGPQEETQ